MRLPRLLFLPYNSDLNFLLIGFRCMKLQKPDLVHSPVSYCLNYNQVLTNTEQKVTTHHPSLPAASFSEVGDWCELGVDGPPTEPTVVQILHGLVGVLLLLELDVDIADQMISQVVTDIHLLHWAVFVLTFYEHVFEEVIIMFLQRICI